MMPKHLFKLGRRRWARTLWLVYGMDALVCSRCGRRMRLIAVIVDPLVIGRILSHRGLESKPPLRAPARSPPPQPAQLELDCCLANEEALLLDPLPPEDTYLDDTTELSSECIEPLPPDEMESPGRTTDKRCSLITFLFRKRIS